MFNELKHKKETKILHWAIEEEQEAEDLFSNCSSRNKKPVSKALQEINSELKNQHKQRINQHTKHTSNHLNTIHEHQQPHPRINSRETQQQMRAAIQARRTSQDKSTPNQPKMSSADVKPNTSCPGGFKKKSVKVEAKPEAVRSASGFGNNAIRVRANSRETKTANRQQRSVSHEKKEGSTGSYSKKETVNSSQPEGTKWEGSAELGGKS